MVKKPQPRWSGMVRAAAVLLVCLAVAGCASAPAKPAGTDFTGLTVDVSATTGAIRGVVVDERVVPVTDAQVEARGAGTNMTTQGDAQGRFVFSNLKPGTYFLTATSPTHKPVQTSADVVAGVAEPPLVRMQAERLFKQDPYTIQVRRDGFLECSQDGASVFYSSSTCADGVFGPASKAQPALSNLTTQQREWHSDVSPGWQALIFEMTWEATQQGTSAKMGMVISTYKPTRDGTHCFAELIGASPDRLQIDVGKAHDTSCGVAPNEIPPEGMNNMSYFVSVRSADGLTPGVALNQRFTVYLTMFQYGRPSDGWSVVNGDAPPF